MALQAVAASSETISRQSLGFAGLHIRGLRGVAWRLDSNQLLASVKRGPATHTGVHQITLLGWNRTDEEVNMCAREAHDRCGAFGRPCVMGAELGWLHKGRAYKNCGLIHGALNQHCVGPLMCQVSHRIRIFAACLS